MSKTKLYIFSGLPASGKSTLAMGLSKHISASYLRIDTVEQGLKDICGLSDVQGEGYGLSYLLAADNLKLGNSVVADSVNPIELSREEWNNVAISLGCDYINVEVICSDKKEHKHRAEGRKVGVKNLNPPTWEQIQNREYHPWKKQRIIIDTANKKINESLAELLQKLRSC